MPKFEKEFVHFMWDDKLKGKKVFYADDIDTLIRDVADGKDMHIVKESEFSDVPFEVNGDSWTFCYYDPYSELKLAHEQGKTIQAHVSGNMWVNIKEPSWEERPECYRIKPDEPEKSKPITNRELSKWLAQGNGEYCWYDDEDGFVSKCLIELRYFQENANEKVVRVKIRKWTDQEWHEPSREYMELE